jgi:uncharacterized protein YpbB
MICPDEVLRVIAEKKPANEDSLLSIKGFNNRMFNKLGEEFLAIIKEFTDNPDDFILQPSMQRKMPESINETFQLLLKGYDLKSIASLRKLAEPVISMQIETILDYKPDVNIDHLFKGKLYEEISEIIETGIVELKELKKIIGEKADYPLLRIALAKYKSNARFSSAGLQENQ